MFARMFPAASKKLLAIVKDSSDQSIIQLNEILSMSFIDVNIVDDNTEKFTPLMWAVYFGQLNKIMLLLNHDANPFMITASCRTILHIALAQGHFDIYEYLVKRFPDLCYITDNEDISPRQLLKQITQLKTAHDVNAQLLSIVKNEKDDNIDQLTKILNHPHVDVDIRDVCDYEKIKPYFYLFTPLMWTAWHGHLNQLKLLLKHQADCHLITEDGYTALHIAALAGQVKIYHYLAEYYSDLLYIRGEDNLTPDELARLYGQEKMVSFHERHYTNSFFSSVKLHIPSEIAGYITGFIHQPHDLNNLSLVNKSWNELVKNPHSKAEFETYIRQFLHDDVKDKSWLDVLNYYYLPTPGNHTLNESDSLKKFIFNMTTFYIVSYPMTLGEVKQSESYYCARLGYYLKNPPRITFFKNKDISLNTIKSNYKCLLSDAKNHNHSITIYKSLKDAFNKDYQNNHSTVPIDYIPDTPFHVSDRIDASPIFAVTINIELALRYLNSNASIKDIKTNDIVSVINYRLPTTDRHMWDDDYAVKANRLS